MDQSSDFVKRKFLRQAAELKVLKQLLGSHSSQSSYSSGDGIGQKNVMYLVGCVGHISGWRWTKAVSDW